jgi:hypothetical protein
VDCRVGEGEIEFWPAGECGPSLPDCVIAYSQTGNPCGRVRRLPGPRCTIKFLGGLLCSVELSWELRWLVGFVTAHFLTSTVRIDVGSTPFGSERKTHRPAEAARQRIYESKNFRP